MDFTIVMDHEDIFAAHQREEIPNMPDYDMHVHDYLELYLFLDGTVSFCVETSVYPLQPGDLILTRAGEAHFAQVDPKGPYERLYFQFPTKLLTQTLNRKLLSPFMDRPIGVYNHYSADELPSSIVRPCMEQVFRAKGITNQMRTVAYMLPALQAVYDCWEYKRSMPQPDLPTSLPAQIVSYINQHLYELQTPAQLAQYFYISKSQLNRIFRSFTGSSVWDYVTTKRLFAAREMICAGTLPHKAATECGYGEYSTFFRAYKKKFSHSPQSDYADRRR